MIATLISKIFRLIKLTIITIVGLVAFGVGVNLLVTNEEAVTNAIASVDLPEVEMTVPEVDVDESVISEYGANVALGLMAFTVLFALKRMFSGGGGSYYAPAAPSSPELTKYYFQIKRIRQDGSIESSISNQGPFEAAHIGEAKGMLAEHLAGSLQYGPDRYVISKANGGGKQYV